MQLFLKNQKTDDKNSCKIHAKFQKMFPKRYIILRVYQRLELPHLNLHCLLSQLFSCFGLKGFKGFLIYTNETVHVHKY